MNETRKNLLFVPLLLLAFLAIAPQLSGAAGCPRPTAFPTGIFNYSCVLYTNTQSTAFASNVDVNVIIPEKIFSAYTAANVMNQEFFFQNGTVAFSWMEGNYVNATNPSTVALNATNTLLYWVNTQNQQTGASTSNYIYLGFGSKTSDFYNAHTGVNPTIYGSGGNYPTTTYGGADNGKYVFPQYWNFTGTTLPSGIVCVVFGTQTCTATATGNDGLYQNNGIKIYTSGQAVWVHTTAEYPTANILEANIKVIQNTGSTFASLIWESNSTGGGAPTNGGGAGIVNAWGISLNPASQLWGDVENPQVATSPAAGLLQYPEWGVYQSSSALTMYFNYSSVATTTSGLPPGGFTANYIAWADLSTSGAGYSLNWTRTRIPPPNNQQPSYTIGAAQTTAAPELTLSFVTPIQYGLVDMITATASSFFPNNDIAILINGKPVASGIGSATYNICNPLTEQQCLPVGVQNVNAIDLNSANTLFSDASITITQNITTLSISTTQSNQIIPYSVNTIGAGSNFPVANQITYNLWLNNNIVGTTTSTSNTAFFNLYNLTGCWSWVFNTVGNANYIANSVSASQWCGYVPLKLQNVSKTWSIAPPSNTFLGNFYYPFKLYTQSPSNQITFNLNQTMGSTTTSLQSGALNISYIPPSNQLTGNYLYGIKETEYANSITIFESFNALNMTDMNGKLTFAANTMCSVILQYNPNCAIFPYLSNTFTQKPANWSITSDNPSDQYRNFTGGANQVQQFSSKNLSFYPKITLHYSFTSFTINALNNPGITNITQSAYNTQTTSAGVYTRNVVDWNTYDQYTLKTINAINTYSATLLVNNYTFTRNVTNFNSNSSAVIYVGKSNYQNPIISLSNQSSISTQTNFYKSVGGYCPANINGTSWENIQPYLADANASINEFLIYQNGQYLSPGEYLIVKEASGSGSVQVQSYKMTAVPFGNPLENGFPYQFTILAPNCQSTLYSSALSVWVSPITITLTSQNNVPQAYNYTASATCAKVYNSIEGYSDLICNGTSTNNAAKQWIITIYNATSIVGAYQQLNQTVINGSSFGFRYPLSSNTINYWANVKASIGSKYDPLITVTNWYVNGNGINFMNAGGAILALLFFFIFAFLGYTRKTLGLLILDFGLTIGGMLDILPITFFGLMAIVVVSIILIFIFERNNQVYEG